MRNFLACVFLLRRMEGNGVEWREGVGYLDCRSRVIMYDIEYIGIIDWFFVPARMRRVQDLDWEGLGYVEHVGS